MPSGCSWEPARAVWQSWMLQLSHCAPFVAFPWQPWAVERPRHGALSLPRGVGLSTGLGRALCSAVPAGCDSISLFFFAPSVLDEGWTCAELHLCRAGLDQQEQSTRWGWHLLGSRDGAFPGSRKSRSLGFPCAQTPNCWVGWNSWDWLVSITQLLVKVWAARGALGLEMQLFPRLKLLPSFPKDEIPSLSLPKDEIPSLTFPKDEIPSLSFPKDKIPSLPFPPCRRKIYGPNLIDVPVKSYARLLVEEVGSGLSFPGGFSTDGSLSCSLSLSGSTSRPSGRE